MSQAADPIPLQYAPPASVWPRRVRRILLGLTLVAAAWACWRFGPYAWQQSRVLYWQRQCMNFSLPGDSIVYEEEPVAAAELLRKPDYSPYGLVRFSNYKPSAPPVLAAALVPACWRNLNSASKLSTGTILGTGRVGTGGPGAMIFLHELISPAGHRRLVYVSYAPPTDSFQPTFIAGYNYEASAAIAATWTRRIAAIPRGYDVEVKSFYPRRPPLARVYAGQADANDPAHFTVRYQMWGQEDVLDGRLLDDDEVTLTPRHLPEWPRN